MTRHRIYVNDRVHIRRRQCPTCIFRPGNLMHLAPGRVESMVAAATVDDAGSIPCHAYLHIGATVEPVCRGFYDRHATNALRLAAAMDVVE